MTVKRIEVLTGEGGWYWRKVGENDLVLENSDTYYSSRGKARVPAQAAYVELGGSEAGVEYVERHGGEADRDEPKDERSEEEKLAQGYYTATISAKDAEDLEIAEKIDLKPRRSKKAPVKPRKKKE